MHAYLAEGLTPVGQDLEDDERIQVVEIPVERCWSLIESGELMDAKSMLTVLMACRLGVLPGA
jgi:ADP-ribose pyrophosphatase